MATRAAEGVVYGQASIEKEPFAQGDFCIGGGIIGRFENRGVSSGWAAQELAAHEKNGQERTHFLSR